MVFHLPAADQKGKHGNRRPDHPCQNHHRAVIAVLRHRRHFWNPPPLHNRINAREKPDRRTDKRHAHQCDHNAQLCLETLGIAEQDQTVHEQRVAGILLLKRFVTLECLAERGGILEGKAFSIELVALLEPQPLFRTGLAAMAFVDKYQVVAFEEFNDEGFFTLLLLQLMDIHNLDVVASKRTAPRQQSTKKSISFTQLQKKADTPVNLSGAGGRKPEQLQHPYLAHVHQTRDFYLFTGNILPVMSETTVDPFQAE